MLFVIFLNANKLTLESNRIFDPLYADFILSFQKDLLIPFDDGICWICWGTQIAFHHYDCDCRTKDIERSALGINNYKPENPFKPDSHKRKIYGDRKRQMLMDTESCDDHECELNEQCSGDARSHFHL